MLDDCDKFELTLLELYLLKQLKRELERLTGRGGKFGCVDTVFGMANEVYNFSFSLWRICNM